MAIEITPLTEADIPGAVSAIQIAFADDPFNNWAFDKTKFDATRNAASLATRFRWGMRNGLFYVAKEAGSDAILSVAMWLLPRAKDQKETWAEWADEWWLWLNQVRVNMWYGRGGLNVKRYYIWKDMQTTAQEAVWTDPRGYYFLNIIVTVPEAQGKGVGRKMMEFVTNKADAEHMPCYLESSKAKPNMDIYERWGFKFEKEMVCDDDGAVCKLYCMVRPPKPTE